MRIAASRLHVRPSRRSALETNMATKKTSITAANASHAARERVRTRDAVTIATLIDRKKDLARKAASIQRGNPNAAM